ncbi:Thioesterase/thiol ester dehydrase-isomerase [Sporormia fimetaria CBS 119925]|uniref:Thioesterase/thiol ester dehydrase-isomerase n=1 Tax=Sporormia fimetaria CBS 119925 TaxID=1340428 RepID=A0A6A6VAC2_9PLEO|nr:Thioesterase/thiol ester dehydrase-isomerase [Sporormia fimetaria CBS 119925]
MTPIARYAICGNVGLRGFATRGVAQSSILRSCPSSPWTIKPARVPQAYRRLNSPRFQSSVASNVSSPSPPPPPHPSQPPNPDPTTPPKPKRLRGAFIFLLTSALCFTAGFTMAAAPVISSAVSTATQALDPPTDADTLIMFTPTTAEVEQIENAIFSHPFTKSLLEDPKYIASRPHLKIPEKLRSQNLTGGTLQGPDKIAVPPLQFSTADGSTFVSLQWLGPALCGHPGIVHGGLLATLLDEGLARCCFPALPNKIAVTASLKIDYKKATMAGQVVVLRAETTKVEGRKAWVRGWLETLPDVEKGGEPVVLCEAEALFVEPRGAEKMTRVVPT